MQMAPPETRAGVAARCGAPWPASVIVIAVTPMSVSVPVFMLVVVFVILLIVMAALFRPHVLVEADYGPVPCIHRDADRAAQRRNDAVFESPLPIGSLRLIELCGFVREGLLRERWRVGNEVQDAYFYGLLKREWSTAA